MQALAGDGIPVLIPPDANKRKGARPGWDGGLYAFMRRVLATELYRKRTAMIEPVFADTKFSRKVDRVQRRGRAACHSEWRLITATHNLLKLWRARPRRRMRPDRPPRAVMGASAEAPRQSATPNDLPAPAPEPRFRGSAPTRGALSDRRRRPTCAQQPP